MEDKLQGFGGGWLSPTSAQENKDLLLLCFCVQYVYCSQAELVHLNTQVIYMLNFKYKYNPIIYIECFCKTLLSQSFF